VVYATAEPSEALLLGGRTAVLHEGELLQCGPALDVYSAPASERVAQIFSEPQINLLPVELTAARSLRFAASFEGACPAALGAVPSGRYRIGVRAHHVRLEQRGADDFRVSAAVSSVEVSGSETLLHARAGDLTLVAQLPGVHRFTLGTELSLFISPAQLFVFDESATLIARTQQSSAANGTTSEGRDGSH
jgi:glycerol transport system ATP-binding protein